MKCKTDGMHFPEIDFYLKIQYTYRMSSKIPKKKEKITEHDLHDSIYTSEVELILRNIAECKVQ